MAASLLVTRGPNLLVRTPDPETAEFEEDAALVDRARFDPAAFAPLYDRYFDPVYRYCHRRLGNPEDAADATSVVFARALAALPRYRQRADASFRSWLFCIAHNAVTDGYRLRGRRRETAIEAADQVAASSRDGSPEDAAIAAEARTTLHAALDHLSPDQRRVVELRLAGLTGPEIAHALGRTVGSVKIAQHRAYAKLRTILTDPAAGTGNVRRPGGAA